MLIKKAIAGVSGLPVALSTLTANLAAEAARAAAAETQISVNLAAEATTARAAELLQANNLADEITRALAAELDLSNKIAAEAAARGVAITDEAAARAAAIADLQSKVDFVKSNLDGASLDSITEVVAAFQAADSDLNGAITALAAAATSALAAEKTRAEAAELVLTTDLATEKARAEAAELVLTTNLVAETERAIAAESLTLVQAKAYADAAATAGGSVPRLESLLVTSDKIVLTDAPKNGINGIVNYGRISYVDDNNDEWIYPLLLDSTDSTGKTYTVQVGTPGDLDGKTVFIQYFYVGASAVLQFGGV
jgi:hypothetical protein